MDSLNDYAGKSYTLTKVDNYQAEMLAEHGPEALRKYLELEWIGAFELADINNAMHDVDDPCSVIAKSNVIDQRIESSEDFDEEDFDEEDDYEATRKAANARAKSMPPPPAATGFKVSALPS